MKREKALWTGGSSGVRLWCKSGQTGRLAAQALELLHERKMWNEQKPCCLSAASLRFLRMLFHSLSEC